MQKSQPATAGLGIRVTEPKLYVTEEKESMSLSCSKQPLCLSFLYFSYLYPSMTDISRAYSRSGDET